VSEFLYRYRSAHAVLDGFHELERSEIYFAALNELNDPMEGHRDVVWLGDTIAWRNLFKHFVRSLAVAYSLLPLWGDDFTPAACLEQVYAIEPEPPPDAPVKPFYTEAASRFLAQPIVERLVQSLAARTEPVGRYELTFLLRALQPGALASVMAAAKTSGLGLYLVEPPTDISARAADGLNAFLDQPALPVEQREALFAAAEKVAMEMALLNRLTDSGVAKVPPVVPFVVAEFAGHYVPSLDRLLYPDWYTASFVEDPRNAAMWGIYGDGHKGVCLKFRTGGSLDRPTLDLYRPVGGRGHGAKVKAWGPMPFTQVAYQVAFPTVDFFRSLGAVPMQQLDAGWISDGAGGRTSTINAMLADEAAWRAAYWATRDRMANTKTADWAHEREHRLVLSSMLGLFPTRDSRVLQYRFEDLIGVIFGKATSVTEKVAIAKIIEAKCDAVGRKTFEFWQADFEPGSSEMRLSQMELVKLA